MFVGIKTLKKTRLKIPSAKWRSFRLGLDVLMEAQFIKCQESIVWLHSMQYMGLLFVLYAPIQACGPCFISHLSLIIVEATGGGRI